MTGRQPGARGGGVRPLHLAVLLPAGGGSGAGAPPDFAVCAALAGAAERALFDFVLLDGGGGPEPVTVLHALAALTGRIGLAVAFPAGAADRAPYDLARRLAVLDRLSGGRAGGPPGRSGEPAGPQGRPVAVDFGGTPEVLLTGRAPGVRRRGRRVRVLSRLDLCPLAAAGPGGDESGARGLAERLHAQVQSAATDGFVLAPDPAAGGAGLDAFVAQVVPLLRERGSLRTAYTGTTLREHLGLPRPVG
ncbi:LLM class flavin-dependent oxidoreductase [Streptomyces sp. NRRL F-5123]|uniref:LLM class flavin-dependent oxidoreductase n=1 Tax=Streptomyces sp. NRRL F-5123 TaxID=1463856 RepID=UPI0004E19643|nr:LLM class flavin-dependent oxidoreductase [Streptomyces sp. NRRL F-5123]